MLDLLRDGQEIGVAEVAERAGIHRSTVYRRWPTRADLLAEALTLHTSRLRIPNTGSWDQDARTMARELARFFADPVEHAMNAAMAAAHDRELTDAIRRHWQPLVEAMEAIVARAIERGELADDADPRVFVDLLTGPLLSHTLLMREQPGDDYIERLVTAVQRALSPTSSVNMS